MVIIRQYLLLEYNKERNDIVLGLIILVLELR
jgi:hypothetical protein